MILIEKYLAELQEQKKRIAFGLLVAERFTECYKIFSDYFEFGDTKIFTKAMNLIEDSIDNKINNQGLQNLIEEINVNIPNMEDFNSSIIASAALNFSVMVYESLYLIIDNNERRLKDISTSAIDTLNMFIGELNDLDYDSKNLENIISKDALIQEEINAQKNIISYLKSIKKICSEDLNEIRNLSKGLLSNLNLYQFI